MKRADMIMRTRTKPSTAAPYSGKVNKPLADWQVEDAHRLKGAFCNAKKRWQALHGQPLTQEALGDLLGGVTQGCISHYMSARIPLNIAFLLKFCSVVGANPADISPTLAKQAGRSVDSLVVSQDLLRDVLQRVLAAQQDLAKPSRADTLAEVTLEVCRLLVSGDIVNESTVATILSDAERNVFGAG